MAIPFYSRDVNDIIDTANFFLKKIKKHVSNDLNLNYYLYGFVISTFSIPDYFLYQKFIDFFHPDKWIESRIDPMSFSEYVDEIKFYKQSCRTKNEIALKFIQFWICEKEQLMNDSKIKFLKKLRTHIAHRNLAIRPGAYLIEPNKGQTNFSFKGKKGKIVEKNGIGFCEYTLDRMCKFINKINEFYRNECI